MERVYALKRLPDDRRIVLGIIIWVVVGAVVGWLAPLQEVRFTRVSFDRGDLLQTVEIGALPEANNEPAPGWE